MKEFKGKVLFLDRGDINTDEIIPAKYLTEVSKEALKTHLLEDLVLKGFNPQHDINGKSVILTRDNFGCGSSREHAPWALEVNNINLVVAESFARIFRQNMYNCGMAAIELSVADIDTLFCDYSGPDTSIEIDIDSNTLTVSASGKSGRFPFSMSEFDKTLLRAGGWIEYADAHY